MSIVFVLIGGCETGGWGGGVSVCPQAIRGDGGIRVKVGVGPLELKEL